VSGIEDRKPAVPPRVPEPSSESLSATTPPTCDEQPQREECAAKPFRPEIRPAAEPTCCGSGCDDCPF
jgi:hypothetical protein